MMKLIMTVDNEDTTPNDLVIAIKSGCLFFGIQEVKSQLSHAIRKGFLWYRDEPVTEEEAKLIEKILNLIKEECDISIGE